tara:strand:- start:896 stop:1180 length:285 start_codon:yes stop_codon:yes gene_type:complete
MNTNLYSNEELNDIAYSEFVKEVHSIVIEFEHIVDAKTGMVRFNESNSELWFNSMTELKDLAKDFTPYFGGNDMGMSWDFTENLWDEIWNCWGK